jgi:hypothetical protein
MFDHLDAREYPLIHIALSHFKLQMAFAVMAIQLKTSIAELLWSSELSQYFCLTSLARNCDGELLQLGFPSCP